MFLIHILVPLTNNNGNKFQPQKFNKLKKLLIKKFHGLTVFSHSPAEGLWQKTKKTVKQEPIIVFEIMTETKDNKWWQDLRIKLEKEFKQEYIVIRILTMECI